ncbi:MAG: DUF3489 domain-containing protein [Brevundimonas sp.]
MTRTMKESALTGKDAAPKVKIPRTAAIIGPVKGPQGASVADMTAATGWQAYSVRGALLGAVRKSPGGPIASTVVDGVRRYWLDPAGAAWAGSEPAPPAPGKADAQPSPQWRVAELLGDAQ